MNKKQKISAALSLALLLGTAVAPAVLAAMPDSGSALSSVRPSVEAPAPANPPDISVETRQSSSLPITGETAVTIRSILLTGTVPAGQDTITPLLDAAKGSEMTIGQMQALADRITGILRQKGYLVAYAYLPAQQIDNGALTIAVVPGQYGRLVIEGNSRLKPGMLASFFSDQQPGAFIEQASLERALLLANDLAGVSVKAALRPGSEAGTADLVLVVQDGPATSGSVYIDNWGNEVSGKWRLGLAGQWNNELRQGESIYLGGLITKEDLIHSYYLDYRQPLGGSGLNMRLGHSRLDYELGGSYRELGAAGQAVISGVFLEYPLQRSRLANLNVSLGYEYKRLTDSIEVVGTDARKHSRAVQLGVNGGFGDSWGGGSNQYSLVYSLGRLGLDDSDSQTVDNAFTHRSGSYQKGFINLQRSQALGPALSLYLRVAGQWADKNLDSSEKLYLGGADGVRAYNQSEGGGDQGYFTSAELRWRLPGTERLSLAAFGDYGSVQVNKNTWNGAGDNRKTLAGLGLGVLWQVQRDWDLRLDCAWKAGSRADDSDRGTGSHLWLRSQYTF